MNVRIPAIYNYSALGYGRLPSARLPIMSLKPLEPDRARWEAWLALKSANERRRPHSKGTSL